jgi:hypothetical protein
VKIKNKTKKKKNKKIPKFKAEYTKDIGGG